MREQRLLLGLALVVGMSLGSPFAWAGEHGGSTATKEHGGGSATKEHGGMPTTQGPGGPGGMGGGDAMAGMATGAEMLSTLRESASALRSSRPDLAKKLDAIAEMHAGGYPEQ